MTLENIAAPYSAGTVTIEGTKPPGQGTVTLYLNGSSTAAGSDANNGTTWAIGPLTLDPGEYKARVKDSTDKSVFFSFTVPATGGGNQILLVTIEVAPSNLGNG